MVRMRRSRWGRSEAPHGRAKGRAVASDSPLPVQAAASSSKKKKPISKITPPLTAQRSPWRPCAYLAFVGESTPRL
jgi:hypothetical protein